MAYYIYTAEGRVLSDILAFDLLESETHSETCIVTEHNVEGGSPVTDHVIPEPSLLSLILGVTNTPTGVDPDLGRGAPASVDLFTPSYQPPNDATPGSFFRQALARGGPQPQSTSVTVLGFTPPFDRIAETEAKLVDFKARAALCTVLTLSREYLDMVIQRWELTRQEPGKAMFTIDFKQVRFVQTANVAAPAPREPVEPRGASMSKKGQQAPKSPADGAQFNKSDLVQLLGAVGINL